MVAAYCVLVEVLLVVVDLFLLVVLLAVVGTTRRTFFLTGMVHCTNIKKLNVGTNSIARRARVPPTSGIAIWEEESTHRNTILM
jgi:hypothetical protein